MPHIVLDGRVDLNEVYNGFKPIFLKSKSLIKIKGIYLNSSKNNALFSTLVIDEGHQEFFIEVLSGDDKTTVRLYPLTDPKKTDSVKKSLVIVYQSIKKLNPEIPIGKTNLQDYLSRLEVPC